MARLQTTAYGVWQCCTRCHEWLPADDEFFFVSTKSRAGLDPQCKACRDAGRPRRRAVSGASAPARCTDALAGVMARSFAQGAGA